MQCFFFITQSKYLNFIFGLRDVSMGKSLVQPVRWWAESAHPGWNRVKASEKFGATAVAPVTPAVTSLLINGADLVSNKVCMQ